MYRIEVWHCLRIHDTYESHDFKEVCRMFTKEWGLDFDCGRCVVRVYKDYKVLTDEELDELGFYKIV